MTHNVRPSASWTHRSTLRALLCVHPLPSVPGPPWPTALGGAILHHNISRIEVNKVLQHAKSCGRAGQQEWTGGPAGQQWGSAIHSNATQPVAHGKQ